MAKYAEIHESYGMGPNGIDTVLTYRIVAIHTTRPTLPPSIRVVELADNSPVDTTYTYNRVDDTFIPPKPNEWSTWDGTTYVVDPVKRLAVIRERLRQTRRQKRDLGITVNDIPLRTDEGSLAAMTGYVVSGVQANWTCGDDITRTFTAAEFSALFVKVNEYVNACFAREEVLKDAINAADDPTSVPIDTGWPETTYTTV